MRTLAAALLYISAAGTGALCAGCGDNTTPGTELRCAGGASGVLTAGGQVVVDDAAAADLRGAAIGAGAATTVPATAVSIGCAADLVPPGFVALGPAVSFGPAGTWSDRSFTLTVPYKAVRLPATGGRRHVRVVARRHVGDGTPFFPPVSNRIIDDADPQAARLTFQAGELATYQVVAEAEAGTPRTERFAYRAIIGISMGGNAAMSIGLSHPDLFDVTADLGGEPGPSMRYTLAMIRDYLFGGFCTADDEAAGRGAVGQLCLDQQRPARRDQFELTSDFEHMIYQDGSGVGLTLRRDLYMKAARDLSRALSNPALYNPDHPYAPPGVDPAYFEQPAAQRCANPIVLADFFDREFNPDGSRAVITFCDGNDGEALGLGVLDPAVPATNPAEVLLAVDVDGDGRRDPGEPVITNAYEPFADVGADGVASAAEPGYDAASNPDPAGDDHHYQRNPRGTEQNLDFDAGEPYQDVGLDGVAGTCQHGATPPAGVSRCYDVGEGDGVWTLSPNVTRWYENDVSTRLAALTQPQRDHVRMWFDAGIRDFLNASVSANAGAGIISGQFGLPLAVFDGFKVLGDTRSENTYDFTNVAWEDLPRNGYLRYGNPDASEADIALGDGRHVGSAVQLINRATSAFAWLDKQFPGGDRDDELGAGGILREQSFVAPSSGRDTPYALFLPPGYDKPENAGRRYPVVYFLHGYGQEPDDLVSLSAAFEVYMLPSNLELADRFQKFIIVYVDGRCRPNLDGVPVDPTGDRCERGTFYRDAPLGGPAQMEQNLLDLVDHIDAMYRTKAPEMVEISP